MELVDNIQSVSYTPNMNNYMCDVKKKLNRSSLIKILRSNVYDAILFFSNKHITYESESLEMVFDKIKYVLDLIMIDGNTFIFKIKYALEMIYLEDKSQTNKYKYEECSERLKSIGENFKKIDDIQTNLIDLNITIHTSTKKTAPEKSLENVPNEKSESNEPITSSLEDDKKKDTELTNLYLDKKNIIYTKNVNTINIFLNNVLNILYQIQYILNNTTIDEY